MNTEHLECESEPVPERILTSLRRMGLIAAGETPAGAPLAGGVSSDIWRVDLASGPICVKSALPKLRVAAEWTVPVDRNLYEVRWLKTAGRIVPEAVPRLLGEDRKTCSFAMNYLDPALFPVWKGQLSRGQVDLETAASVARNLAAIHAATAGIEDIRRDFESGAIFREIRLDPYLGAAAKAHPDRAQILMELCNTTAETRLSLVHGDVSPKNILAGPSGPVFLDAECAWYGDPAFDLAFCLNHLLLKCLWVPWASQAFLDAYGVLAATYLKSVSWEEAAKMEERAARLLPGLMLARVDGKSPVEYLTEPGKAIVRRTARELLASPVQKLSEVSTVLDEEIGNGEYPD
jgi:aminoglycoside phosphotransferase (APT) family kinase protein